MKDPKECPKCNSPMELEGDDLEVGIVGGWVCTNGECSHAEPYEGEDPDL